MATSTPYDDVFRTLLMDCSELFLPVLNESFGEHYTGKERIEFAPNEHFLWQQDGDAVERITDSCFIVISEDGTSSKKYHAEVQSTEDSRMLVRIFEYDAQIALDGGEIEGDTLTVEFHRSAVLYLRSTGRTPDEMTIRMVAPDGNALSYKIPVMKIQEYDTEALFKKNLLFLLPFHLFRYEKDFDACEKDAEKLQALKAKYSAIMERLEALQDEGIIDEFTKHAIIDMAKEVVRHLAEKHEKVKEGVESTMGGKILDYEAKDILNRGLREGEKRGEKRGERRGEKRGEKRGAIQATLASIRNLMETMHLTMQQAMDALKIPASEQEKYASQL